MSPDLQLSLMEVDVASLRRALVKGKKEREDLAVDSVEQRKRYNLKRYDTLLPPRKISLCFATYTPPDGAAPQSASSWVSSTYPE